MIAWVIQRNEIKKYATRFETFDSLNNATLFRTKRLAEYEIDVRHHFDCKPVKVRIEEVEG